MWWWCLRSHHGVASCSPCYVQLCWAGPAVALRRCPCVEQTLLSRRLSGSNSLAVADTPALIVFHAPEVAASRHLQKKHDMVQVEVSCSCVFLHDCRPTHSPHFSLALGPISLPMFCCCCCCCFRCWPLPSASLSVSFSPPPPIEVS